MDKILDQTQLPDCKIINVLVKKMSLRKDCEFNFILQLEEVRKRISSEVSRINLLFPEYTPHDEKYHLSKLFYIADELLGDDVIENMNIVELFTFSVSLYAHDWGMAISEDEKDLILNGHKNSNDIFLLEDEDYRFSLFCKSRNIAKSSIKQTDWQDYIRETHAYRSASRIKNYFNKLNSGIAEVSSRLCEGHYVDFDIIDDSNSYPTDYAVLRETVNVKALAVYLRLVDLLDLGEDRTPYILWKFVAPRNKFSKMEWAKHRALQPVSFAQYQTGRYIQVDGSSDDHKVYMSIMDLKRYVNDQFKQCNDILNRMNHAYHKINVSHIDWRISARGFKPIPIQFEFDRMRMFEILGDEIYQNDGYVFIRELIQNAVDAIKVRMEVLESKGLVFNGGKILINVEDLDETYYRISITDNGIGMDEYIVRNYLSVAGRSYYNSKDFENEGFKMEPISRFGIGVISCFMLSDYVEIITNRDPYISNNNEQLKISIPSKENYFRIEAIHSTAEIGTTFNVYVLKNKLKEHKIENLNINEYVKKVAGFVEFPIEIMEDDKKTIVLNPMNTLSDSKLNDNYCLSYAFPVENAIKPQYVNIAKEFFSERQILLKEDLKLERFEGCLTFLIPKEEDIDIVNIGRSWPISDVKLIHLKSHFDKDYRIRWNDDWVRYRHGYSNSDNLSVNKSNSFSVFLNGILLANAKAPEICSKKDINHYESDFITECFLLPKLVVNVPRTSEIKIDLARSTMKGNDSWDKQIWEALFDYIKRNDIDKIKDDRSRYFKLGRLTTYYRLNSSIILESILKDSSLIPYPILTPENKIEFINVSSDDNKNEFRLPCSFIKSDISELISSECIADNGDYKGILEYRKGANILAIGNKYYSEKAPASLINSNSIIESAIKKYYILKKIEFITSPMGKEAPWYQEVYGIKDRKYSVDLLNVDFNNVNISDLSNEEIFQIRQKVKKEFSRMPEIVSFNSPYNKQSFYSWKYLNKEHQFAQFLLILLVKIYKIKTEDILEPKIYGEIIDRINTLPFMGRSYSESLSKLDDINMEIEEIINLCSLHSIKLSEFSKIVIEDLVPNSFIIKEYSLEENNYIENIDTNQLWGELIS
jgi:hypothetical protein